MPPAHQGIIHGKTIELIDDPGIEDGRAVEVIVRVIDPPKPWGDGIRASAGAMADDAEFQETMDQIERERKAAQHRKILE
jgi:hypothetical protein